jgi:hypothetical protein
MPHSGTLDVAALLAAAPMMDNLETGAWEIAGVETLQATFEIDDAAMPALLPKALHPTIPPIVIFSIARYPESPAGAFTMAQVRLGCRAAALPRGYLLRAYVDSAAACDALSRQWGFACEQGDVRLQRYHDRISGSVSAGGSEILRVSLIDPEPISGADIQYVANMHLARTADDVGGLLVQVDPEYRFHRAERGRPEIGTFDHDAWAAAGVEPVWPIIASYTVCDTGFPRIRYVLDPERPAIAGTRKLR